MNLSKPNLCKSEWLELVFTDRNKEYGAYYLRQHSAENTNKAMGITLFGVAALAFVFGIVIKPKPAEVVTRTVFELKPMVQPPVAPKKEEIHQTKAAAPKTLVATTRFVPPEIVSTPVAIEPPKLIEMKGEVGTENIDLPAGTGAVASVNEGAGGDGTNVKIDNGNEPLEKGFVDVEPEPYGGAVAWAKFLEKNLRYPNQAMDQLKSGKVWLSFIVEKNGHISSLVVEKGAGYGMDEEALRVLKLAPPWKPGLQHGQPVRVKYTLPLNFILNQ
jgi:periplasmic protein TonB